MNNMPMSGPEALILVAAAAIAWLEVIYGPQLRAKLRQRKIERQEARLVRKTPKSWDRKSFFG